MIKKGLYILMIFSGLLTKSAIVVNDESDWQDITESTSQFVLGDQYSISSFSSCDTCNVTRILNVTKGESAWLKYEIKNTSQFAQDLIIYTGLHIEDITFFLMKEGVWDSTALGHLHPIEDREILSRNLAKEVVFAPNETKTLIIRYRAVSKSAPIFLFLEPSQGFFNSEIKNFVFLSLFYGVLVYLLFYSLLHAYLEQNKMQLTYGFYVLSVLFYLSFRDGLAFQYLWPSVPAFNLYHAPLAFYLLLVSTSFYARYFIKPKVLHWVSIVKSIMLILVTLHVILFLFGIIIPFDFSILYYLVYLLIYYQLCYLLWKERRPQQLLFVIGYSLILIGWGIFKLQELGWISWSYFIEYYIYGALLIEAILFAVSLAQKSKSLIAENNRQQDKLIGELKRNEALKTKVNRELETKVQQRTLELKNNVEQLDLLNSKIDKLNWQLKKNVYSEKLLRIENTNFSYIEFLNVFPNSLSCYQYLAKLKLNSNYCEKENCSLEMVTTSNKKIELVCSLCRTKGSSTKHTLFHALKFDITKAFYIAYLEFHRQSVTNESMSKELDLRTATLSNFRKKVKDKLKSKSKSTWSELLLMKF